MSGYREGSRCSIIDPLLERNTNLEIVEEVLKQFPDDNVKKVKTLISVRRNMSKRGVLPSQKWEKTDGFKQGVKVE